jgi:hypothetical protein
MPSTINKQPVFTATPVLVTRNFQTGNFGALNVNDIGNNLPLTIFQAAATEGTLVERITIRALADVANLPTVSEKLVYIWVYAADYNAWSIYDVVKFPSTSVTATTPPPYAQLTFTGGLILNETDKIAINQSSFGNNGDGLSVTLEGSTYTAV